MLRNQHFYVWSDLLVVFGVRPIVIAIGPQPQLKERNIETHIINICSIDLITNVHFTIKMPATNSG